MTGAQFVAGPHELSWAMLSPKAHADSLCASASGHLLRCRGQELAQSRAYRDVRSRQLRDNRARCAHREFFGPDPRENVGVGLSPPKRCAPGRTYCRSGAQPEVCSAIRRVSNESTTPGLWAPGSRAILSWDP